jgi:hypothetical protein
VPTPSIVILILKIAVGAVTLLLAASMVALVLGKVRLHGRINIVFFILTMTTVVGFELLVRFLQPGDWVEFASRPAIRDPLSVHLWFSIPSAVMMPFMLYTGLRHHRSLHLLLAVLFAILWIGTFITGIFFLPVNPPAT